MKHFILYGLLLIVSFAIAEEPLYNYVFFSNSRMEGDYFFSRTDFKSPSVIKNINQKLPVNSIIFHTPGNALQLEYVNGKNGDWQVVVFKPQFRGQDHFKQAKFFSFRVYIASSHTAEKGLPAFQFVRKDSSLSKKNIFGTRKINSWESIIVPVSLFADIDFNNPSDIIGIVFSQNNNDEKKHTIYIDDIELLPENYLDKSAITPVITATKGFAKHIDITWQPFVGTAVKYVKIYRSKNGKSYQPVGIQEPGIYRFADYVNETGKKFHYKITFLDHNYRETKFSKPAMAATKSLSDDELLTMVQEACFRYYWEGAEANSGLAKENIPGRRDMIASGASGFGIMALLVGIERKFIIRNEAIDRFTKIVDFLEKAEIFHGAFPHFIDGPTGKVEPFFGENDNGGDLVETSFLVQGLLAAREYFNAATPKEKNIREKITGIWKKIEWSWYKKFPESKFLFWHWSPDKEWIINHRLIGWNETMATYLLAIASPSYPVPAAMYYTGWASQDSIARQYRNWGGTSDGSLYTNGNTYYGIKLDVGVSNGGPLFFTHYSYLGYDPHFITDKYTNYFNNNRNIALINYKYCLDNPHRYKGYGDSCWGLTASDGPYDYSADEPVLRQDRGKIAPTGAISSFPYTPAQSMKALKNYYYNYGEFLWGEYGFRDAFNLTQNWCSEIYMGLNQAPMVVMIENYRSGLLWRLFMSCPEIKNGLKKLGFENPWLNK